MYIFLAIWFLFLLGYIIFNAYGLIQVMAKRFRGDAMGRAVLIYLISVFIIIFVSVFFISRLDWGVGLGNILKF